MKWSGKIGFFVDEEVFKDGVGTGVWKQRIVEKHYSGDLLRDYRTQDQSNFVNESLNISNTISIVCDRFIDEHIMDIKYIEFKNKKFKVKSFTQNYPRIEMTIGGLYNGQQT